MYDDMYALEDFLREKMLQAHLNKCKCEKQGYQLGEERYASQEYAYGVVLNKIQNMRVNQWPHIKRGDLYEERLKKLDKQWADKLERDIDYVL